MMRLTIERVSRYSTFYFGRTRCFEVCLDGKPVAVGLTAHGAMLLRRDLVKDMNEAELM